MDFWTFRNNLKTLTPEKITEVAIQEIDNNKVIKLNQDKLVSGFDSEDKPMPNYTKNTIALKKESGGFISPSGKIALKDKGDLFNDMQVFKQPDFMSIFSTDEKYQMLIDRYGKDVFGLNEKDAKTALDESNPKFIKRLQEILDK